MARKFFLVAAGRFLCSLACRLDATRATAQGPGSVPAEALSRAVTHMKAYHASATSNHIMASLKEREMFAHDAGKARRGATWCGPARA